MKCLAISDIHSRVSRLKNLRSLMVDESIDLILLAGDLTNGEPDALSIVDSILSTLDFAPILAIPGNIDSLKVSNYLFNEGISLHKKSVSFKGQSFVGFGGAVGGFSDLNYSEFEMERSLVHLFSSIKNPSDSILVTHSPPKFTKLDTTWFLKSAGSLSVLKSISHFQPKLALSGHVHESNGVQKIGSSLAINVSAAKSGQAVIFDSNLLNFKRFHF